MPSIGPAEILVIMVVALLVFGPKRLPEVGRQVGHGLRELRKMQDTVRSEFRDVIDAAEADTIGATTAGWQPLTAGADPDAPPVPAARTAPSRFRAAVTGSAAPDPTAPDPTPPAADAAADPPSGLPAGGGSSARAPSRFRAPGA